jgi:secreted PhoX family phosphatase
MNASQTPVKRTALGRVKHENAELVVGQGGRAVVYMGDDERFDYIYKFVSESNWRSMQARGISPLDQGKLYVAKFNDDGTGNWIELTINNPALAARFADQAEVLTYARIAADTVGATPMDRPEWIAAAPNGEVYCTLTNNTRRTTPDAPNPLAPNPFGHIIKWRDSNNHVGTTFTWDIFVRAVDTHDTDKSAFGSPDGLWSDSDGRLFIETDGTQPEINGVTLNDQMLVADTNTGEIRRIFSGVTGCEVTGITVTPDRRTMFVNLQHPGDGDPTLTNFPAQPGSGRIPRDATVVITRKDGGIVGS